MYMSNRKSVLVAYLENYKAKEISFKHVEDIPPDLKFFTTLQFENNIFLAGGMNTVLEDPEKMDLFDYASNKSFLFDIKSKDKKTGKRGVVLG